MNLEVIIFYLLLIDSIAVNLLAWTSGQRWYQKHFRIFSRWFPAARGWSVYYLVLVLLFGYYLNTLGLL